MRRRPWAARISAVVHVDRRQVIERETTPVYHDMAASTVKSGLLEADQWQFHCPRVHCPRGAVYQPLRGMRPLTCRGPHRLRGDGVGDMGSQADALCVGQPN